MRFDVLINGYKQVLQELYAPKQYYERIHTFLKEYKPNEEIKRGFKLQFSKIRALFEVTIFLGIRDRARIYYWKMVFSTLRKYPRYIGVALTMAAQGFHFRKVYEKVKLIKVDPELLKIQTEVLDTLSKKQAKPLEAAI